MRRIRLAPGVRAIRRARLLLVPALAAALFVAAPVAGVRRPTLAGCAVWTGLASGLEALSVLGFLLVFKLVFGARMSWRQSIASGLRGLGASSLLPAGGIVGPAVGARSSSDEPPSLAGLTRPTIAFTVVNLVPEAIVLGLLGLSLRLGWLEGPRDAGRTLPAAAVALAILAVVAFARRRRRRHHHGRPTSRGWWAAPGAAQAAAAVVLDGLVDARSILAARNWKLLGALGYYAFDNAVLWAAFHAYGHTPPASVIVMGYLVGSLGSAVPLPGGVGAVEGGLIGALVLYGAPAAPAAGAVLLYRSVSLLLPVALSACAWMLLPARRLRAAIRVPRSEHGSPSAAAARPLTAKASGRAP
ncbi:MAG: flippase-like domain-containing protein [Solirubrobacterales bacterium]|nr:flippase-like domain-containing protein [Solirubrobacterales bacterium]